MIIRKRKLIPQNKILGAGLVGSVRLELTIIRAIPDFSSFFRQILFWERDLEPNILATGRTSLDVEITSLDVIIG